MTVAMKISASSDRLVWSPVVTGARERAYSSYPGTCWME